MSLKSKSKETVFPQSKVKRNFNDDYLRMMRTAGGKEDSAAFLMLAEATCSGRETVNIEKIHVDVFENKKISHPTISVKIVETMMIRSDKELMKELQESRIEAKKGRIILWKKAKKNAQSTQLF